METRIREIREAQGMSRRVLADRAHVGYDALAKWESNTNEIGLDNAALIITNVHKCGNSSKCGFVNLQSIKSR